MSKRAGEPVYVRPTKVKKRKGVGSRIISVPNSDEEDFPRTSGDEYARVTKTRIATSGKAERVYVSTVPVLEVEQPSTPTLPEEDGAYAADVEEKAAPAVKKKRRKKDNDSVSDPVYQPLCIADHFSRPRCTPGLASNLTFSTR